MRFRARKTVRLGPLRLNFTQKGFSSYSIRVWRYTWNSRTRQNRFDTPGWGGVVWGGKKKGQSRTGTPANRRTGQGPVVAAAAPVPYRPRIWPWALWGVLFTLAILGGVSLGGAAFFLAIAAAIAGVQLVRRGRDRAGTPAPRDTGDPALPFYDPAEAERIVQEWAPPEGWSRS